MTAIASAAASCWPRTASSARLARAPRRSVRCLEPLLAQSAARAGPASWYELVTSAEGGSGPPDRITWLRTWQSLVRRAPECEPLIGWMVTPSCLLCVFGGRSLLLSSWPNARVVIVSCVASGAVFTLQELLFGCMVVDMPRKRPALSDVEPSDTEESSSESEAGASPAGDAESTGAPVADPIPATASQDPVGGEGSVTAPARGGVAVGGHQLRKRGCTPHHPKPKFVSRTCGLCNHPHVFQTRKGLNKHSTACHGQFYSLAGNCFVPIQAADLRVRMDKLRGAQQHRYPHGAGPRSRGGGGPDQPRPLAPSLAANPPRGTPRAKRLHGIAWCEARAACGRPVPTSLSPGRAR